MRSDAGEIHDLERYKLSDEQMMDRLYEMSLKYRAGEKVCLTGNETEIVQNLKRIYDTERILRYNKGRD